MYEAAEKNLAGLIVDMIDGPFVLDQWQLLDKGKLVSDKLSLAKKQNDREEASFAMLAMVGYYSLICMAYKMQQEAKHKGMSLKQLGQCPQCGLALGSAASCSCGWVQP